MAKSVLWEVVEFFATWFGALDFLVPKTNWLRGANVRSWGRGRKPIARRFASSSPSSYSRPSINTWKKKDNNYNREELMRVMNNAKNVRELLSWIKTDAKRKNHNLF
jgi:hypothetical protein